MNLTNDPKSDFKGVRQNGDFDKLSTYLFFIYTLHEMYLYEIIRHISFEDK